jgi:outer membrane protein assembly factor BamB
MLRTLTFLLLLSASTAHAELLWEYATDGMVAGNPVVHEGSIYITGGTRLHVLNRQGELQWAWDAGAPTRSTVAVADGVVFALADDGLHAVDTKGTELWRFETRDGPFEVAGATMGWGEGMHVDPWALYRSAPLVVHGKVVFGNRQGTRALDARTGKQLWHAATGTTHTRPACHEGIVVVGSWDNYLYGLNLADGSVAWKVEARLPGGEMGGWAGWEGFSLDPVIEQGVVYVGSRGTYFYAIDAKSGIEKWSWKHPSSWIGSPAVVNGGMKYRYSVEGGYTHANATRDVNHMLTSLDSLLSLTLDGDTLYAGSANGNLYAISLRN